MATKSPRRSYSTTSSAKRSRIASDAPAAIVAAGGRGERAADDSSAPFKQWRNLGGRPLIEWSIETLSGAGCSPIIIVVPPEMLDAAAGLETNRSVDIRSTEGGATRQESVAGGLRLVESDTVVIHDAARPFASERLVAAVLAALADADGAIVALPLEETIKQVSKHEAVVTLDRDTLWRAQTPQAFRTEVLRDAHERAVLDGLTATDDAQLVETYGGRIAIVTGDPINFKLTYPHDFVVAEALIQAGF